MAIIKFINNKVGLKRTLNYICKEEKTNNKFISGKDCMAENAYEEMIAIKNMYGKTKGREKLHFVQAFSPNDELSYETAHEIAMKIAEKYFKGYQVVVATHQDKEHIHSHFVVNTVNFETGKKIQFSNKDLESLKAYSNKLCLEQGLSITREKSNIDDIRINEYKAKQKGISWKEKLEKSIDIAMEKSNNKFEFFKVMNEMGYKVTWTKERKNITYTTSEGYKCRDRKLHNEKYLKENMEAYFKEKYKARIKGVKKYERHTQYRSMSLSLAELIKQFQRKEHENDITHHYELNESAKKQYAMEMHYSLEELEDMEMQEVVVIEKQNMYVLIIENEKNPELKRIPNRLETLRKIVGNEYIDVIKYKDVLIVFDEEAYKKLLPINRTLDGLNIRGTFIVTGNDKKNQDFKDLTKEQIEEYTKKFQLEQENQMEEGEELE